MMDAQSSFSKNVLFFAHMRIRDVAYISSITQNSISAFGVSCTVAVKVRSGLSARWTNKKKATLP